VPDANGDVVCMTALKEGTGVLEYLGGKGLARRYRVRRPRRGGKMSVGSRRVLSQLLCEIVQ